MSTSIFPTPLVLLWFLSAANYGFCSHHNAPPCNQKEKIALVKFKQGLTDPSNSLSSWSVHQEEDCCRWSGVQCHNITGRVIELHLRSNDSTRLGGKINPSLLELEFLNYLDLSVNDFATHIPSFIGSMGSLTYLNLSNTYFEGLIPHQLGNLSTLRYLDLSDTFLDVDKFNWVGGLYSLEYLDMSYINLGKAADDWLQVVTLLPSLSQLHLVNCGLENLNGIPPLGYVNFTSLQLIDLSRNNFSSNIPNWLFNLSNSLVSLNLHSNSLYGNIPGKMSNLHLLNHLDLSNNLLTGQIPEGFGQLKHLQHLDVHENSLQGPIPDSLGNLSSLRILSLSINQLNGTLPRSIWLLSNLDTLDLYGNSLAGIVSEANFATLTKLRYLDMSLNSMVNFSVDTNWIPPFQLQYLGLSHCNMGPKFPFWLRTQTFLKELDISQSGISDTAPHWFWKLALNFKWFSLSNNQIYGDLSNILLNSTSIDMSSNRFQGCLPKLSPNVDWLNIANNSLSGLLSSFLCQKMHRKNNLYFLDLSNNQLSGGLSRCWMYWRYLSTLNLGNNKLFGKIPNSMGTLVSLHILQLQNNNLLGNIPSSLRNCTQLELLNLGGNEFTGLVQNWIGEMTGLVRLLLRSNKFIGNVPPKICQLFDLALLDLANNSLSGTIPTCLNNFSAMATKNNPQDYYYPSNLRLVTKGRELEYTQNLRLIRSIDLSSNNLSGSIPDEIASLVEIQFLNLSRNHLTGKLPEKIGNITNLESLDLSRNYLSGEIPQSMSNLTFLDYLDLSYNNFSGRIPSSTQIQSFEESSFTGNAELCGPPLLNNCTKVEVSQASTHASKGGDMSEMSWFCIGLGPGFATGFWGVCGVLFFNRNWRHAYFQFLNNMKDRIYVAIVLTVNRFRKWFKRCSNV